VQGDARPLVADDVVEVEDLALLRRWRVPTPACPSAPARRCRRWSSRIRATRCCRPCSRSRPRPLPLGGRLPAGALLRVRIEGQLRWKVGVRQADYEAGEECEINWKNWRGPERTIKWNRGSRIKLLYAIAHVVQVEDCWISHVTCRGFFLPNNDIHLLTRYVVTLHMLMSLTKNYS